MAPESFKEFKKICQGTKIEEQKEKKKWWHVGPRFISIYITWILVKTPISPNFVTVLSIILGITGLILVGFAYPLLIIIGFILIYIYFILDEVDGEIARYKKKTSVQGIFYDEMGHILFQTGLFFSFGFSLYRISSEELYIILGSALSFFLLGIRIIRRISVIAATKINLDNVKNFTNQKAPPEVKKHASKKKSIKIIMFIFRNILTAFCTTIIITTTFFVGYLLFIYFDNFIILEYIFKGYFIFMIVMFLVFIISRAKTINKDTINYYHLMKE